MHGMPGVSMMGVPLVPPGGGGPSGGMPGMESGLSGMSAGLPGMGAEANPMMGNAMMPNMAGSPGMMGGSPMMSMMTNPMMAMMGGMGCNPMMMMGMGCNPMMGAIMGGCMGAGAAEGGAVASKPASNPLSHGEKIDPKIVRLCKDFGVEERLMRKLNTVMERRPETFNDDLNAIREKMEGPPKVEIGVLISQLERGTFVASGSMPEELVSLVRKYQLDHRAAERLVESLRDRKDTRLKDIKDLDIRLQSAERPSGLLMKLLQGLDADGKLPPAPRSLGLPGSAGGHHSHRDRADSEDRKQYQRSRRSRSRRSRSRRR